MGYLDRQRRKKLFEEKFAAGKTKMQLKESVLMEASWKLPFDVESATKLKKFMEKAQPKETALDNLYYIFGDDELFDSINDAKDPTDVRYEVKCKLRELLHAYDNNEVSYDGTIDQETRKILNSILEVQLNEEILKSRNGCSIRIGSKVKIIKGPEEYINCTGKVDWVGDDQAIIIFDDSKPVKQNLLDCSQLEVIKSNELDEDDQQDGDGKFTLDDGNEVSVEVDGQVVTDPPIELTDSSTQEASDSETFGPELGMTEMLLQAVNDENSTIQFYNSLIATATDEGFNEVVEIVKHINEEENIHVGMLQHVMSLISEQATAIESGKEEAENILSNNEEEAPVEEAEVVAESFLMEDTSDKLSDAQALVDNAIKLFGRVGAGLYTELDELGFYIDESNGQYVVKKKVPDMETR